PVLRLIGNNRQFLDAGAFQFPVSLTTPEVTGSFSFCADEQSASLQRWRGAGNSMAEKILLVDDDSNILDGYRRSLGREFDLDTALSGQSALVLAAEKGPFAVVVSDMRMPGMDGVELLTAFRSKWPDTVRVMLTGNADRDTAVHAINEGSIFRFLN